MSHQIVNDTSDHQRYRNLWVCVINAAIDDAIDDGAIKVMHNNRMKKVGFNPDVAEKSMREYLDSEGAEVIFETLDILLDERVINRLVACVRTGESTSKQFAIERS